MQLKIEKIVYPGKSFSVEDGKVFFTDEGLTNEIVEIEPLKEKNNYIEAKTINIIEQSDKRAIPRCNHYKTCSPYQYIDYSYQLLIKESQIKEDFAHHLNKELKDFRIKPSQKLWEYRNKLRLHIMQSSGVSTLAYHVPGYHDNFLLIDKCFLASEKINRLFAALIKLINAHKLNFIEEVEIKESSSSGQLLLILFGRQKVSNNDLNKCLDSLKNDFPLAGIIYIEKNGILAKEVVLWGKNYIEETILNKKFNIGAQSFFQININILETLVKDITETAGLCGFGLIADLYCGIGTFGIILAEKAAKIIGVESEKENIIFLKENIKINKLNNYDVYKGLSENLVLKVLKEKINIVIADPPRKGLDRLMCENLLKNPPKNIFYISCNPSTLIRDLKMLLAKYDLVKINGYDFFPHTPHIETFTHLARKK